MDYHTSCHFTGAEVNERVEICKSNNERRVEAMNLTSSAIELWRRTLEPHNLAVRGYELIDQRANEPDIARDESASGLLQALLVVV